MSLDWNRKSCERGGFGCEYGVGMLLEYLKIV